MTNENFIEMRLNLRITKGLQVSIIQILPILTAAGWIHTLIRVLLQ
jgi:hypothetical protein